MMQVLELLRLYVSDEATLNSEEIKPVALAIIELHLPEGHSQSVGWSVSQSVSQQKFC